MVGRLSPAALTMIVSIVAAVVTLCIVLVPELQDGYRDAGLHVAVETTAALASLLVAMLALGRFQRARQLDYLLLASAFVLLSVVNLVFRAVPAALTDGPDPSTAWGALGARVVATLLLAAAATTPPRIVGHRRALQLLVGGPAAGITVGVMLVAVAGYLPETANPDSPLPPATGAPGLAGRPVAVTLLLTVAVVFAIASVGFVRRAQRTNDGLITSLAVGCALASFSAINYALFQSSFAEWVYVGDAFRMAFYLIILVAAIREITSYWEAQSQVAVLEERRRLARDLHDGLAQELAYIVRNLRGLPDDHAGVTRVRAAAERALTESRHAIQALSATDRPLHEAVADAVTHAARRSPINVTLDLAPAAQAGVRQQEALVRIAAEAVTNAGQHASPDSIRVELEAGPPTRLRVIDRGCGFDRSQAGSQPSGFGLAGMEQRAAAVGATLRVDSAPGRGTTVEVEL